jgi:Undecaprenyl-phosphate galactose phosphotransferase WbaP
MSSSGLRLDRPAPTPNPAGELSPGLRDTGPLFVKRLMDVVCASLLLLVTLPLFVAIAVAIMLDSRGPVMFGHTRVGKRGRCFKALKFRSMVRDADSVLERHLRAHPELRMEWQERHKLREDPRVTRVGRVLRRLSLDELPQLLNVLRGEMSMVGPRPIVEEEISRFGKVFPLYTRVKPGLTGLWQVSDRRRTTYRERIELDLTYMRRRTLGMDLLILVKTVRAVVFGHGAY